MKRTSTGAVVGLVALGAGGGFLVQIALASASAAKIRPEYTLSFSLALIATLVVVLAIPVWRSTHGDPRRPVDPFRATRVVLLAKASAYLGAGLTGVGVGFLADVLLRPVAANADSVLRVVAMLGASILLLVGGLVAEHLCTVPPDDDDPTGATPAGGGTRG